MSDFFGKLKSGAGKVTFEADKMTRLNRAKGDLEKAKGQIQAQYTKLGEMYYTQRASLGVSGPAYDEICQAIVNLEQQVASKNDEIQRINAEVYTAPGAPAPQPAFVQPAAYTPPPAPADYVPPAAPVAAPADAAATKFCTNCGKEMPVATKFCPDCGTKV
ncbi:MAG: zinc ribbon domain-containing protein [Anaerolineaceae bacterium]|nr:zinc ribbon domain-containing protein [Anaerolineaceae bacterium]